MNVTLQLLFTIVLLWAGKNSGVETWNLRCFETSDLDFETRVSDPLSLSCWRTIPHYNLVIIIELSVVNVGNLTTTYLVVWNLKLFWIFWDSTTICQIHPALFCDILPPKTSETEILCNLSTKGVVQTLPWLNWLMSFAYSITRYF